MAQRFDAIVLGMGPGGEVVSGKLIKAGKKVAVVEKELILEVRRRGHGRTGRPQGGEGPHGRASNSTFVRRASRYHRPQVQKVDAA